MKSLFTYAKCVYYVIKMVYYNQVISWKLHNASLSVVVRVSYIMEDFEKEQEEFKQKNEYNCNSLQKHILSLLTKLEEVVNTIKKGER